MNSLDYLSRLIDLNQKSSIFDLTFDNKKLEEKYFIYNMEREKFKIKFGCFMTTIGYLIFIISTQCLGRSTPINLSLRIGGIIIDIVMSIFQIKYFSFQKYRTLKLIRYAISYLIIFSSVSITLSNFDNNLLNNEINNGFMLVIIYSITVKIYFLDFNIISLICYVFITTAIYVVNVRIFLKNSNFQTYFMTLLTIFVTSLIGFYQRDIQILNRKMFFESYKNEKISEYIQKLLDDLNLYIISMKKDEILYINKKFGNDYEFNGSMVENEIAGSFPDENTKLFSYFTNLQKIDSEPKTLKDEIEFWFNDTVPSSENEFNRIGQFIVNNQENPKSFEIYFRKSNIDFNNILDIVMYDLTKIKKYEKEVCENKYKQKILGKIAHEFKTPLITISSIINSVENETDTKEKLLVKFGHVKNLSDYTIFLISDVISYVSDKAEKLEVLKLQIDLKEITLFSYNVLKTLIECNENKRKLIKTNYKFDSEVSSYLVISDEIRLKQILLNLISNSYKFTKNGEIILSVEFGKNMKTIEISVKDTGVGINPNIEHKILKEDIELNVDIEYNKYGSGIGLSISKMLSNLLNHKIFFKKRKKGGTKFTIEIEISSNILIQNKFKTEISQETMRFDGYYYHKYNDISKNNELTGRNIQKNSSNLEMQIENEIPFSIVIIDDLIMIRQQIKNLIYQIFNELSFNSYEILEGSDGIDLLSILKVDSEKGLNIKLIFIDENMEYLNGSQTIKIIRGLEEANKFKKYQIISATAFEDKENKEIIKIANPDQIIHKPFSKNQLSSFLKPLINCESC